MRDETMKIRENASMKLGGMGLRHRLFGLAAAMVAGVGSPCLADEPSEAGDWHFGGLMASSRLQENFFNAVTLTDRQGSDSLDFAMENEQMVDTFFPGTFGITDVGIALSGGTISGDLPGSYALGAQGRMTLTIPGEVLTSYLNLSRDTFVIPVMDIDDMSFNIGTRLPTGLTTAAMAGDWAIFVLSLPHDLTETYYNVNTTGTRMAPASTGFANPGEVLADVFFAANPSLENLSISVDAAGNITGDVTGTTTINPGSQSATLNLVGVGGLPFYPNSNVDIMTSSFSDADSHTAVLAVKPPPALSVSDLEGVWRWQTMEYPARLREHYYNASADTSRTSVDSDDFAGENEQLVDVFFSSKPETNNGLVTIDALGNVVGSDPGVVSVGGTTITFTPSNADPAIQLQINATKDVIVGSEMTADVLAITTLVKVSGQAAGSFEELVDVKLEAMPGGTLDFNWNESSSFKLFKSSSLSAGWTEITGTAGEGGHQETPGGTSGFYRIEVSE